MLEFVRHLQGGFMLSGVFDSGSGVPDFHGGVDLLVAVPYFSIGGTLGFFFLRNRSEFSLSPAFTRVWIGLVAFLLSRGLIRLLEIGIIGMPPAWIFNPLMALTGALSVSLAWILPSLLPKTLTYIRAAKVSERRKQALERANVDLGVEISERKAAEAEIRNFNSNLEELVRIRSAELELARQNLARAADDLESSGDPISSFTLEGLFTGWNSAAERLYGYRKDEIMGRHVSLLALPGEELRPVETAARIKRGEYVPSFETVQRHKTGAHLYLALKHTAMRNQAGDIVGVSVTGTDLPQRRRTEEMFRIAYEAAPTAMVMVDGQGKIVLVNAKAEALFGYERAELLGGKVDLLVPQKHRDLHPKHRHNFAVAPQARPMGAGRDLFAVRKDGSEFPVEIALNPIRLDREVLVLSLIVDITQRKQDDEEIRRLNQNLERRVAERTAELSKVNAELESFSYSVAHDLRAPLRHIAGFSKLLAKELGPNLGEEPSRYLKKVQDGALRMGALVDDLLLLARISRQALSRRPTDLNELVETALTELEMECAGRDIEWQIEELWTAQCDAGLMKQVFVNFLSNAIKFTRFREHAFIHVGKTMQGGEAAVFIADNGAGFDMAYSGKLFGVFQRFHKAADFDGVGVGLANVQRIIQKHGGRTWAEAEVEQGATFFFTIPEGAQEDGGGSE